MVSDEASSADLPIVMVVLGVKLEVTLFIDTPTSWQEVTTNVRDREGLANELRSRVTLTWVLFTFGWILIIWSMSLGSSTSHRSKWAKLHGFLSIHLSSTLQEVRSCSRLVEIHVSGSHSRRL